MAEQKCKKSTKPHEVKVICNVCGKHFLTKSTSGALVCPECFGDKRKALNRIFTRDTVKLICKWYDEETEKVEVFDDKEEKKVIAKIGRILGRSEENVIKALKIGGKVM